MSELTAVWTRIEAWYEAQGAAHLLHPGASAEAIAEAEATLGLAFPAELRASLTRHDGTTWSGWASGELLPLQRLTNERAVWMERLEGGNFDERADHNAESTLVQAGWWNPAWIPLHADGGGNGMVIDLAPAEAGAPGQVLFMDHETGPEEPEYASLTEYLAAVADALEAGLYVLYDDAIVAIEDLDEEMADRG